MVQWSGHIWNTQRQTTTGADRQWQTTTDIDRQRNSPQTVNRRRQGPQTVNRVHRRSTGSTDGQQGPQTATDTVRWRTRCVSWCTVFFGCYCLALVVFFEFCGAFFFILCYFSTLWYFSNFVVFSLTFGVFFDFCHICLLLWHFKTSVVFFFVL